jgi:hypothetical protein
MRKVFAGLATLLAVLVVAQFFFAAAGGFSTDPDPATFRPHHALGYVIFTVPLVMAAVAALARMPRRLIGLTTLIAGLVTVQVLIGALARGLGDAGETTTTSELVFGLHGVNGLVILAVSGAIVRQAWASARASK